MHGPRGPYCSGSAPLSLNRHVQICQSVSINSSTIDRIKTSIDRSITVPVCNTEAHLILPDRHDFRSPINSIAILMAVCLLSSQRSAPLSNRSVMDLLQTNKQISTHATDLHHPIHWPEADDRWIKRYRLGPVFRAETGLRSPGVEEEFH